MPESQSNSNPVADKGPITQLLIATREGDKNAVNELFPLVYDEMRKIARKKLRFERSGHTFDTTALVHEAYFRLIDQNEVEWQSRAHFLAIAAQAMRRILLNYAEYKNAQKRGGDFTKLDIDVEHLPGGQVNMDDEMAESILALNNALDKMEEFNERGCRVVEYHFFGGLTWKEISEVMGVAPITVRRTWNVSKLWLNRELNNSTL